VNGGTVTTTVPSNSNKISAVGSDSYTYDAAGNITDDGTNTYTWNNAGQLAEVLVSSTPVGTYTYDSQNRRVKKVAGANTTHYVYGLNGLLYGEYDNAGDLIREYVYLNDTPLAQIDAGAPETVIYLHPDHLSTPRFATNSGGTQVWAWAGDAFGVGTPSGSATINIRMPGQYVDSESGLFYNWNRYYNPAIGRYISSDPIGIDGGLNTFLYADASPVMYADPTGEIVPIVAAFAIACAANPACVVSSTAALTGAAIWATQKISESTATQQPEICDVHGNSSLSERQTEVYYLINRTTGAIDKIGITSNPQSRYSDAYLRAKNVRYEAQAQYNSRYPAMVDENIRLVHYRLTHGDLPRLNKTTR